jgi:hypothetical protein
MMPFFWGCFCQELLKSLSEDREVGFIWVKKRNHDSLYPGGTKREDKNCRISKLENTEIRNILTYYNPLSLIWAGVNTKGDIIRAQWWSYVLAHTYLLPVLVFREER